MSACGAIQSPSTADIEDRSLGNGLLRSRPFFFRRAENNGSAICLRSHLNRRIPATGNTLLGTEFSSVVLGCLALLVKNRNTKNNTLLQWRYFCDGLLPITLYLYNRSDNILLNQICLLLQFGWDGDLLFVLVQILDCDPRQHKYERCTWEGVRHGETTRCWDTRLTTFFLSSF